MKELPDLVSLHEDNKNKDIMASLVLISAILISILALEQVSLMIISAGTRHGRQISALKALFLTAGHAWSISWSWAAMND